jgi:hypothetical protein
VRDDGGFGFQPPVGCGCQRQMLHIYASATLYITPAGQVNSTREQHHCRAVVKGCIQSKSW